MRHLSPQNPSHALSISPWLKAKIRLSFALWEDVKNYEVKQKRRKEGVVGHAEEAFELISRPSTYSRNLSIYKCIETGLVKIMWVG
ncbi:hypothetical protein QQP08_018685 [Theobroma cacao]|nr:hypothetical protein QQP08_018685 [Theobroma cacao]